MTEIELKNDVKAHDIIAIDRMASLITTHYKYKAEFVDKLVAEYDHQSALLAKAVEALEGALEFIKKQKPEVTHNYQVKTVTLEGDGELALYLQITNALETLAEINKGQA